MLKRSINPLTSNSFFLFGARGTGKTTLLRETLPNSLWIDLLLPEEEETFLLHPEALRERIRALSSLPEWVVIDEIQKAPKLLDVVHHLIEEPTNRDRKLKFALTGSSARKLKQEGANLLAGRAFTYHLYPLTQEELGDQFDLEGALAWGTLPFMQKAIDESERRAFLKSYTATYLKEEIILEQLIRKVPPFRKFLPIAAQSSGTIVNYENIARDLRVDWATVRNYFEILEDTLIGFPLPAYTQSLRKQQLKAPKFYLFDTGVTRALANVLSLPVSSGQIRGPLFEQFIVCELHRLNHYHGTDYEFFYLATQGGLEIDVVVERPGQPPAFIEIKSSSTVTESQLKHLKILRAEHPESEFYCFCLEPYPREVEGILVVPWVEGLRRLGL